VPSLNVCCFRCEQYWQRPRRTCGGVNERVLRPDSIPRFGSVGIDVHQAVGCRVAGQGSADTKQPARLAVAGASKASFDPLGNPRLAARRTISAPDATAAMGQHRHEGSQSLEHSISKPWLPLFTFEHDARPTQKPSPITGNLLHHGTGMVAIAKQVLAEFVKARHPCGRPVRPATGRGAKIVCEILERIAGLGFASKFDALKKTD